MPSPYTKIVYGSAAATAIGNVLGWAASDADMKIKPIATETTTPVDGETKKVVVNGHGMEASGNLIVPTAAIGTAYVGMIVQISTKNHPTIFRPYRVTAWEEHLEGAAGLAVAAFTAISEDAMVDAYNAGPLDPETGAPLSGLKRLVVNMYPDFGHDPYTDPFPDGLTFGLFGDRVNGDTEGVDDDKIVLSKAAAANASALAQSRNGQVVFYVPAGTYCFAQVAEEVKDGKLLAGEETFFEASYCNTIFVVCGFGVVKVDTVAGA